MLEFVAKMILIIIIFTIFILNLLKVIKLFNRKNTIVKAKIIKKETTILPSASIVETNSRTDYIMEYTINDKIYQKNIILFSIEENFHT